ncbi:MAG: DUF4249 domain-containing protein [Cyclobacteriaceae bacterium]
MFRVTWIFSLLLGLLGCTNPLDDPLPVSTPKMVVQGWITDRPGPHEVVLSTTAPFDSNQPTPKIAGATVMIVDDQGAVYPLFESSRAGYYQTADTARGVVGRSYALKVFTKESMQYQSLPESLVAVPSIESFSCISDENQQGITGSTVSISFTDFANQPNFYRWKVFINGENKSGEVYLGIDDFIDGNQLQVELGFYESKPLDVFRIEQLSLTESGFEYLEMLTTQTFGLGTVFSPAPAPIPSNLHNVNNPNEQVLGYFGASSVASVAFVKD